jgi:hypothetical protein
MHPFWTAFAPTSTLPVARMLPCKRVFAPMVTIPAMAQMTFCGRAPPARVMRLLVSWLKEPEIWKIQAGVRIVYITLFVARSKGDILSVELPVSVISPAMVTAVVHLYVPGTRFAPTMRPEIQVRSLGSARKNQESIGSLTVLQPHEISARSTCCVSPNKSP